MKTITIIITGLFGFISDFARYNAVMRSLKNAVKKECKP